MSPELIVINTVEGLNRLIEEILPEQYIAYDCETTGLTDKHEVIGYSVCCSDLKAYYVILAYWDTAAQQLTYYEGVKEASRRLLFLLKEKSLIMHNGIFDCKFAESYFKIRLIDSLHTDTMVLAHILDENRSAALKSLGAAYFGEDAITEQTQMKESVIANGGKWAAGDKEMYKADQFLIAKYGAKDALLTFKLFLTMVPELYEQQLDKFFYEDESMPLLRTVTYELNTVGLNVDVKYLMQLKRDLSAKILENLDFINSEINHLVQDEYPGTSKKNTFNIGSSSQLAWLLFGKMKLEFGNLTKEGKTICKDRFNLKLPYTGPARREFIDACLREQGQAVAPFATINGKKVNARKIRAPWAYIECNNKILTKYAPHYKWIAALLEYQKTKKILNTYVEGIIERTQYGVIQPSFNQTGTSSGRYSSSNPNFQNLPRDDKRIKQSVVARPGKVFVGADYSQLEPRVFAYTSQDTRLMAAFTGEDDFYSVIGMEVYNRHDCTPRKDGSPDAFGIKYKKLRNLSKVIALASTYGATARNLASTTGKSIEDTQADIDNYFDRFPGVKQMMLDSHEMAKRDGHVLNLFGRPRRMPEAKKIKQWYGNTPHEELPYQARTLLNLAVNHRIQGTAASIVNRAAIQFKKYCAEAGIDCQIVVQVHDSLVAECHERDAENVAILLQEAMENTVILQGVNLEAMPQVGKTLADV